RARSLPIQRSLDVAVPLEVAWDQWELLKFIPEGTHRVAAIERDGDDRLVGRIKGVHAEREWEAEVVDERVDESFAWHSVGGSDCSGLVTFHRLSDRLTRIELHLDVIPGGVTEALELVSRVADRRAEAELRRFKAFAETLDPDEYPPLEDDSEPDDEVDGEEPDDDVDGEYDTEED
ncbi:MAG: cyclase/dehydrase, partial [Solirubrobacterales bacterium]|nr:cyclase/dehydrase [Solirubrobacterales bacterium]